MAACIAMGVDGPLFRWQSLQFNPTMRYQLPIYPLLAMMAAWFVFELARLDVQRASKRVRISPRFSAGVLGISVVVLTRDVGLCLP